VLDAEGDEFQVPRLERFRESFVKKAEAMQKIALVRLTAELRVGGLSYGIAANEPISPFILSVFYRYSASTVQPISATN
jgi:hypothetical protein